MNKESTNENLKKSTHVLIPKSGLDFSKPSAFDIFVPVGGKFVKVVAIGATIDQEQINRYLEKNSEVLYIESASIERFLDEKFATIFDSISQQLDVDFKCNEIVKCLELCLLDLKLVRLHADKFMRMTMVVDSLYEIFKRPDFRAIILKISFNKIKNEFSRRSLVGSFLSLAIFLEQNEITKNSFDNLMFASILRDFFCSNYGEPDPHFVEIFDDNEKKSQFLNHPQKIIECLKEYKLINDISESLIIQHHESPDGKGFPQGLKKIETYLPAQCVWLADWLLNKITAAENTESSFSSLCENIKSTVPAEQQKALPYLIRVLCQCYGKKIEDTFSRN